MGKYKVAIFVRCCYSKVRFRFRRGSLGSIAIFKSITARLSGHNERTIVGKNVKAESKTTRNKVLELFAFVRKITNHFLYDFFISPTSLSTYNEGLDLREIGCNILHILGISVHLT